MLGLLRGRSRRVPAILLAGGAALAVSLWAVMIRMPGQGWKGALPKLDSEERRTQSILERHVDVLATHIGERNMRHYENLVAAANHIAEAFEELGYAVDRQPYAIDGRDFENLEVSIPGSGDEIVVVGAHYDSALGTPGANDNASGVAVLLALAERLRGRDLRRTLRFVAFTNEEMPHFRDGTMGSLEYARRCRRRGERISAMFSLETMGYFSNEPKSQHYPFPVGLFYPSAGNFIGFVGNLASRNLVRAAVGAFRKHGRFPSEGAALPSFVPGVGWSDHASFWAHDYPAVMVTDTAPFRYPHYHEPTDTPDKVDFDRLTRVTVGLEGVLMDLAR